LLACAQPEEVEAAAEAAGVFIFDRPRPLTRRDDDLAVLADGQPSVFGGFVSAGLSLSLFVSFDLSAHRSQLRAKPWERNQLREGVGSVGLWLRDCWRWAFAAETEAEKEAEAEYQRGRAEHVRMLEHSFQSHRTRFLLSSRHRRDVFPLTHLPR